MEGNVCKTTKTIPDFIMDQDVKEIILSLGGVVTGFVLSEGATFIRSYREVTREGEAFDFVVSSMKPVIEKQIKLLNRFHSELTENKNTLPEITIMKDPNRANIDRHKVVKYYSRKKDKKEALRLLNLKMYRLDLLELEIERYKKYSEEFSVEANAITVKYFSELDKLTRKVADFAHRMGKDSANDEYYLQVWKIANSVADIIGEGIIDTKIPIHDKLFELYEKGSGHSLQIAVRDFNIEGLKTIGEMMNLNDAFAKTTLLIKDGIEQCYKDIYPIS